MFEGSNVDRFVSLSHRAAGGCATRRCGCRTFGASHLHFVTDMLIQFCSVAGQVKGVTLFVGQHVIPRRTAQAALDGCLATGIGRLLLAWIVLPGGPGRTEQQH